MNFEQIMEVLNNNSAIISALSALIAIVFSVFVWFQTRKLLKPTERPIFSVVKTRAEIKEQTEPIAKLDGEIYYTFRNTGKHPAKNLRSRYVLIREDNLQILELKVDMRVVNRIDPGSETIFHQDWTRIVEIEGGEVNRRIKIYIYILMDYENWYNPKKHYYDEYWYCFTEGKEQPAFATVEEKKAIESKITELYPDRKKID